MEDVRKTAGDLMSLWQAAQHGNIGMVERILPSLPPGSLDRPLPGQEETILIAVSICGLDGVVQRLLEAGASVDVIAGKYIQMTALHHASLEGNKDCVSLLLEHGANKDLESSTHYTPIMLAVKYEHVDCVTILLDAGVNVDYQEPTGTCALTLAASSGNVEIVRSLLRAGADVDVQTRTGRTPLYIACRYRHEEAVEALLEAGADVNIADVQGITPLLNAVERGHSDVVRMLLLRGADPNAKSVTCVTPLVQGVGGGSLRIIKMLIQYGCDVNQEGRVEGLLRARVREDKKYYPLELAASEGFFRVVHALLLACCDVQPVMSRWAEMEDYPPHLKENHKLLGLLQKLASDPVVPLLHICRRSIRELLISHVAEKTENLPLPRSLLNYLNYRELEDVTAPRRVPVLPVESNE